MTFTITCLVLIGLAYIYYQDMGDLNTEKIPSTSYVLVIHNSRKDCLSNLDSLCQDPDYMVNKTDITAYCKSTKTKLILVSATDPNLYRKYCGLNFKSILGLNCIKDPELKSLLRKRLL